MVRLFTEAGARPELLPLLAVRPPRDPRPLDRAASELPLYDWLVFTSTNAVEAFLPLTGGALPHRLRVAVVGEATARAVESFEAAVHLIAPRGDAESLVEALRPHVGRQERVLVPQAADARPTVVQGLTAAGAEVVPVTAYDKALPDEARAVAAALFAEAPLGWVTFTSPRIVRHFLDVAASALGEGAWSGRAGELRAASIGPVTSEELRRRGIEPAAEAALPGTAGLVEAVIEARRATPSDAVS